jgi:NAD(P)-dependent dehydrogenase (short-subunit alcohol dehydrogenase family)
MPVIAIVGAGPGMGLAIARTFGSRGFDVALISRNQAKLDALVSDLAADGIKAAAFPADVLDHQALTRALNDAAARYGRIDVLEYSPVPNAATANMTAPSQTTPADVQQHLELGFHGAIAATQAVLPAMRAAGAGTLLYTTGAGSVDPNPMMGNINAADAALRNWILNLHKELADEGIQAAHVAIGVFIGSTGPQGFPTAMPDQIAPSTGTCTSGGTRPSASSPAEPPLWRAARQRALPRMNPRHEHRGLRGEVRRLGHEGGAENGLAQCVDVCPVDGDEQHRVGVDAAGGARLPDEQRPVPGHDGGRADRLLEP